MNAAGLIRELNLQPHPEGGWYCETWRSQTTVQTEAGERSAATGIFYLLESADVSAPHRVRHDELWCWHAGGALELIVAEGHHAQTHVLGDPCAGLQAQALVPGGRWFGARPQADAPYVLVSCVVAPGFEFADFELATAEQRSGLPAELAALGLV